MLSNVGCEAVHAIGIQSLTRLLGLFQLLIFVVAVVRTAPDSSGKLFYAF